MLNRFSRLVACLSVAFLTTACEGPSSSTAPEEPKKSSKPAKTGSTTAKATSKPAPSAQPSASAAAAGASFSSPKALFETWSAAVGAWDLDRMYACYKHEESSTVESFKKEFNDPEPKKEVQACFAKATFDRYEPSEPDAKDGTVFFKGCPSKTDGHIVQLDDGTWRVERF